VIAENSNHLTIVVQFNLTNNLVAKMSDNIKISIVIATYNRKDKIKKVLESIWNQTSKNFEVIVVDDASTDGTFEYLSSIKNEQFRFFRLPENSGSYKARNLGIDNVEGTHILIWDSDDFLYKNAVEVITRELSKMDVSEILITPADFVCNGKSIIYESVKDRHFSYQDFVSNKIPKQDVVIVFSKEMCGDVRFLGPNIDFSFYAFLSRKAKNTKHVNISLGLINLESDQISETFARNIPNIKRSIQRIFGLRHYLNEIGPDLKKVNSKRYLDLCYGLAVALLLDGKRGEALFWLKESGDSGRFLYRLSHFFGFSFVFGFLFKLKSLYIKKFVNHNFFSRSVNKK
jgi:glycosyltransferase involved in cell wall biosynthesis